MDGARRIVAVGGGRGDVGKSTVAVNLAIALAKHGCSTVLVDADVTRPSLHRILDVKARGPGLGGFLFNEVDTLSQAMVTTPIEGLALIPGLHGAIASLPFNHVHRQRLSRHLRALDVDAVVIDAGTGTSPILDALHVADVHLLVVTPHVSSVQGSYTPLRAMVQRMLKQLGAPRGESERVWELLLRVAARDPMKARAVEGALRSLCVRLVGNRTADDGDRGAIHAAARMLKDHLGVDVGVLGCVSSSRNTADEKLFRAMAQAVLEDEVQPRRSARAAVLPNLADSDSVVEDLPLPADPASYARREPRLPVQMHVTVESAGLQSDGLLLDLSASGALLQTRMELEAGDPVRVIFPSDVGDPRVAAVVRNKRGGSCYGLEFLARVPAAVTTSLAG